MAENNCVVCFKNCRIYSIGECDHPVCYECSTRMRVLCRQNECPMCRHEMGMVVFTEKVRPFRRLKKAYVLYDSQHNIAFESNYIRDFYDNLLHYVCKKCQRRPIFDSFESVNDHMKREHDLYCCDLCADNLKIFPAERRYYTKQELNRHRRIGDIDDRSHRGHPLCEFCDVRYMDRDELYRHLRKEHLFCHICDSEGIQQFYGMYDMLREHYKKDHFLCEEGDCYKEQLTSVFPTEIDLKAHKALVHCKNIRNRQAAKQARTLELEFTLAPRNQSERHRGRYQEGDENTSNQNARGQEPTQTIVASWDEDFPSLTNSGTYATSRPRFVQKSSQGFAINDRNFPALGSETNIRLNVTNSVDSYPSSSAPVTSANISVQVNRKKPKVRNQSGPQPNGTPSSSMLSLTWVKKAKEKKPPPEPPMPAEAPVKPPTLNGKNFPTLNKNNVGNEAAESTKKNKKSTLDVHIDENDNQRAKVNYSKAIAVAATKNSSSEAKTNNKKPGPSKAKETTVSSSQSSNKDNKTPCFLLNANRKKVKMKPEAFTILNDAASSQSLLPQSSTVNYSKERKERKANSETNKLHNAIVRSNNVNCDKRNTDEKIKNSDKKSQVKEKRESAQRKDVEKRDAQQKNKENEPRPTKSDRVEKEKKNASKSETKASNVLKSSDNSGRKMEKTETSEKKTDQKSQRLKKSELKISPMSDPDKVESSKNSASTSVSNKPPPGLGKPAVTSAPPGFVPLQNGFSSHSLSKTSIPLLNDLVSDTLFVYQQPVDFVSRNSQLIEKINNSLVNQNEDALNEFKSTSLLFREGYISATDYYFYCLENIKSEKFVDVFVDLVALLPNILKQQELWTVHQATMPSSAQDSLVGNCSICFQILKVDDGMYHYAKHGVTADAILQCADIMK